MNNMPSKKSIISLALGSAFAATLGTASVASAADNPFAAQSLQKGFMVADSHYDNKGGYGDTGGYGDRKDGYGDTGGYGDRKDAYGGDKKYGEGRCGMSMADTDNDGRVSREEHARHAEMMFNKMDTNKDGYIDKDEASAMRKKYRGHGHGSRPGDQYGGSGDQYRGDQYRGNRDGGVDVHRYREYGAGETVPRDLPHMRPMGE
ncbi:EF-hand domain-containing protein [Nitrosospira multiformis]|uniref:EF-hand domain-containing protein n=1 Tax=Nitrosospira multiformis TaxID=1231 RepID=UPI0008944BCE|nr:EF-hand domain-containing protein [Nitrosospira multiformis]SEA08311.1 EF hand [Nitrosospira multiformis]